MNKTHKGFVLGLVPYREHDAMVHFLSEDLGLLRLVLRAYYKPGNKQASKGLEFSKVKYLFNYRKDHLNLIINGELINAYLNERKDFTWLLWMSLMSELVVRTYDEVYHEVYLDSFERSLAAYDEDLLLEFLVKIIRIHGFTPSLDGCIHCGKGGINVFSIEEGGFLCSDHSDPDKRQNRDELLAILSAFKGIDLSDEDRSYCLSVLMKYLEYHGDYRFNAWRLLKEIE